MASTEIEKHVDSREPLTAVEVQKDGSQLIEHFIETLRTFHDNPQAAEIVRKIDEGEILDTHSNNEFTVGHYTYGIEFAVYGDDPQKPNSRKGRINFDHAHLNIHRFSGGDDWKNGLMLQVDINLFPNQKTITASEYQEIDGEVTECRFWCQNDHHALIETKSVLARLKHKPQQVHAPHAG